MNDITSEELLDGDERIIAEAKRRFRMCQDFEGTARNLFLEDVKFANGDSDNLYQWPDSVRRNREIDERPCLTINKTRQHNLQIINDARQHKSSPNIRPVGDGATFEASQVFDGIIRHIEYISNAQDAYTTANKFQVEGGIGFWRVTTDYIGDDSFDQEIYIRRIKDPGAVYIDPDINEKDGSDARFGFVFEDMPRDEFNAAYPQYKDLATQSPLDNTGGWVDKDHVRVAEYYRKVSKQDKLLAFTDPNTGEQVVQRASKIPEELVNAVIDDPMTKHRIINDDEVEYYLIVGSQIAEKNIWPGKYIPIVRVIGEETIIDGVLDRKGHTRAMKDPQRNYNYWASCGVEFIGLQSKSPYIAPVAAIEGLETYWESANRVNHSVLPYNHLDDKGNPIAPPQRQQPPVMAAAYVSGMQFSDQQMMMVSGQYEATFGQKSNETSGRAIDERQRQGDNATYHFIDNMASALRFTGKILLDLIPKIYDTPRVVRILAEDGSESYVQLDPNHPNAYQGNPQAENQEEEAARIQVIKGIFNPNVGRYDVISDVGPSYATKRQEAYNALSQIMIQNPQTAMLVGDLWAENADFPTSDKIAERFRNMLPPGAKGQGPTPQEQQMQQQLQNMQQLLAKSMQELAKSKAHEKVQSEQKDIDVYKAITDRLDVLLKHFSAGPMAEQELMHDVIREEHAAALQQVNAANTDIVKD